MLNLLAAALVIAIVGTGAALVARAIRINQVKREERLARTSR